MNSKKPEIDRYVMDKESYYQGEIKGQNEATAYYEQELEKAYTEIESLLKDKYELLNTGIKLCKKASVEALEGIIKEKLMSYGDYMYSESDVDIMKVEIAQTLHNHLTKEDL